MRSSVLGLIGSPVPEWRVSHPMATGQHALAACMAGGASFKLATRVGPPYRPLSGLGTRFPRIVSQLGALAKFGLYYYTQPFCDALIAVINHKLTLSRLSMPATGFPNRVNRHAYARFSPIPS